MSTRQPPNKTADLAIRKIFYNYFRRKKVTKKSLANSRKILEYRQKIFLYIANLHASRNGLWGLNILYSSKHLITVSPCNIPL